MGYTGTQTKHVETRKFFSKSRVWLCIYVYAWVSIYISIYKHTHIYARTSVHREEALLLLVLVSATAPGFLWGCILTVQKTQRFNSAILWVILKVSKLWQINKWPQQDKLSWNIRYCMSLRNQLAYFPLVVSQANYYFSVQKINNLNALQPIGKYFRQADEQCAC